MESPSVNIQQLAKELDAATASHKEAAYREDSARRETTEALNVLNRAQKAFDAAVKEIRDKAPRASDWKQFERQGVALKEK